MVFWYIHTFSLSYKENDQSYHPKSLRFLICSQKSQICFSTFQVIISCINTELSIYMSTKPQTCNMVVKTLEGPARRLSPHKQTQFHYFNPQKPHNGWREITPVSYILNSTYAQWHTRTHIYLASKETLGNESVLGSYQYSCTLLPDGRNR